MTYFGHRKLLCKLLKLSKLNSFFLLIFSSSWCIYSCLQIPPRENWFQYVRRVCATVINFPCIITLILWFFEKFLRALLISSFCDNLQKYKHLLQNPVIKQSQVSTTRNMVNYTYIFYSIFGVHFVTQQIQMYS